MEKNDLRYLLDCEELPEYNTDLLIPVWDSILKEYQQLTNSNEYSMNLRKEGNEVKKHNRLNGLISCYHLLRHHFDCSEDLKHWGILSNNIDQLQTRILQEQTKLNIEKIQKENKVHIEEIGFIDSVVLIENFLNRDINSENITVEKWVSICKSIKEKSKAIDKIKNQNGRQNTSK